MFWASQVLASASAASRAQRHVLHSPRCSILRLHVDVVSHCAVASALARQTRGRVWWKSGAASALESDTRRDFSCVSRVDISKGKCSRGACALSPSLSLSLSLSLPSVSTFRSLCRSVALPVHVCVCVRVAWGRDGGRERSDSITVLVQENTTVYYTHKLKSQRVMSLSTLPAKPLTQQRPCAHLPPGGIPSCRVKIIGRERIPYCCGCVQARQRGRVWGRAYQLLRRARASARAHTQTDSHTRIGPASPRTVLDASPLGHNPGPCPVVLFRRQVKVRPRTVHRVCTMVAR
jgi:hypothetical protein